MRIGDICGLLIKFAGDRCNLSLRKVVVRDSGMAVDSLEELLLLE